MERAALLHRPDSEYAYLFEKEVMHVRLRTKKDDVKEVKVIKGDPYLIHEDKWYEESEAMVIVASTEDYDYWQLAVTAEFRRIQYAFHVIGVDGEEVFYGDRGIFEMSNETIEKAENYFRMPFFQEIDRFKSPEWVKETVWYQIFPERFANGDKSNDPEGTLPWGSQLPGREDFFGGDLQGVIDHLDYLVDLGINGLYFCPIFKASSNHKYDTIDYFDVDPDFGDKALFKKLVEEAHKRGIKVMLDAVFNHMGYYSPQFQDVVKNEEKSKYKDWFHIHSFPVELGKNGNEEGAKTLSYDTFAFTPMMPKLNTANKEVQDYLLDIATYWIKEFNIDAWRLDVANEVDHHFWKRFYEETTALDEDFYILGEIWHSSQSWLNGDEFHAVMNYAFTETVTNFFVKEAISSTKMASGLYEQLMLYRDQTNQVMFNCLDSHDTARLLHMAGENKDVAKMTLAFTFMQHGSPCIYYGTEIGMTGANDPDCRRCMVWEKENQDLDFLEFTKQLVALRRAEQPILSYGTLTFETLNNEDSYVEFTRETTDGSLKGYFNKGTKNQVVSGDTNILLSQNIEKTEAGYLIKENGFIISK
ncbi:glycoside hydrolase family 13 protein [Vagococcus carniphilus]|uniref:Alpha-glycosidase n=1 Tax=Vagococcus carniphilus TaxID=218144 RepID=A0A430AYQ4_9ENTE|nr:glycoside hydrolase family 13 protein [Vagococcus carniphilus]QNN72077.1 alpha-glycosidase [Vagococcus carniphilus]RSU13188.1 alpha-glycosidase [Vagococcus carniphilus]